jgi:hypothetical protein
LVEEVWDDPEDRQVPDENTKGAKLEVVREINRLQEYLES